MEAEFAGPLWGLGQSNYVLMDEGRSWRPMATSKATIW